MVTWRLTIGANTFFGWAVPDLDPNSNNAYNTHGSFVNGVNGRLYGLGTKAIFYLPNYEIPVGATFGLRYDPMRGTMHARVNSDAEALCFTGLRKDLIPAVCIIDQGNSCQVVVRNFCF